MVGGKPRYNVSLVLGVTALGRVTCQLIKQNQVDKFIPENELPQGQCCNITETYCGGPCRINSVFLIVS
jgi:hypothetical protein